MHRRVWRVSKDRPREVGTHRSVYRGVVWKTFGIYGQVEGSRTEGCLRVCKESIFEGPFRPTCPTEWSLKEYHLGVFGPDEVCPLHHWIWKTTKQYPRPFGQTYGWLPSWSFWPYEPSTPGPLSRRPFSRGSDDSCRNPSFQSRPRSSDSRVPNYRLPSVPIMETSVFSDTTNGKFVIKRSPF